MESSLHKNNLNRNTRVITDISDHDIANMNNAIQSEVVRLVANQIANDILVNHYNEIMANINQKAIANLAIAEVGAKISKILQEDLNFKKKTLEEANREVWRESNFL